MRERDDETQATQYPLLTDIAGAIVVNPIKRIRLGVILFAVAIVVAAGASAYVSTSLAGEKTEQHTHELLADMNRRTADRKLTEARQAAVLEQNRRTLCELIPGVAPTSEVHRAKLAELKHAYQCGTARDALVPPGWSPPPGWPALPPGPDGFTAPTTPAPTPGR